MIRKALRIDCRPLGGATGASIGGSTRCPQPVARERNIPDRTPPAQLAALALALLLAAAAAGCGTEVTEPTPPAPGGGTTLPPGITAGPASGPVAITYLGGTVAPGATVTGCGVQIAGCAGRVAITVRLKGTGTGAVLWVRGFLHATSKQACLLAQAPGFLLEAGVAREVTLTFDQADACQVPLDIANLAVNVEGVVQVSSRQEWAVSFAFRP